MPKNYVEFCILGSKVCINSNIHEEMRENKYHWEFTLLEVGVEWVGKYIVRTDLEEVTDIKSKNKAMQ